jgi:ATP-dependent Lon protease
MADKILVGDNKMENIGGMEYTREEIKAKLRQNFDGKIVRKDLTKKIKEGANVPVYVLEFLLGQYCSSDDEAIIEKGVQNVKRILADNFVRPDEAQKILSQLRKKGSHTVIDMITVNLDIKKNCFFASFSNLGLDKVPIADEYPEKYDRLLCGGIWCIVQLDYEVEGDNNFGLVDLGGEPLQSSQKKQKDLTPISIRKLTPIQMPHIDIDELKRGRKAFTKDEWLDILLRSIGMEPDEFTKREKWLLLTRMIPLVENNFNLCELGPRSTGKSHLYKEISPNSILISGGQTTVANLFYNMGRKSVGLVGLWDCVAFDEVAGAKFKDKDGIQIMKDYMASGSFARGKEEKAASASMVFVGNINQSVDVLLKTSSLFDPFPPEMGSDTAFLDRIHCYLPGWEIPKFRPEHFTNDYGFISDYLAEFIRELRKEQYGDALDHYFRLGKNLNQRDTIAVRRMVDGYLKLMYPDGVFDKSELEEVLQISLEMRRRVKEQLKKLGGMEFYDVNFSYIDLEDMSEHYVSVPEQGGGKLIPDGMCNPGQVYTVSRGKSGMIGVFRLESQMLPGSGKFERTGLGSDRDCKESTNTAFNFLKANGKRISGGISTASKDYIINYQDLQGIGMTGKLALPTLIALCSIALGRPTVSTLAVLGEISISGTILKVDELANSLQVCLDSGAKKVLLPITSAADLGMVPPELVGSFNLIFYSSAEDAVFKALGVE